MDRSEMESLGEKEIRTRLDRGDFSSFFVRWRVRRWLSAKAKAERFRKACEDAAMSSALRANRSARTANIIATIALITAIAGNHDKITAFITDLLLRYF